MPQTPGLNESLEFGAESPPHVHSVALFDRIQVDSVVQPEAGEERVAESFVRRQPTGVESRRVVLSDSGDVVLG